MSSAGAVRDERAAFIQRPMHLGAREAGVVADYRDRHVVVRAPEKRRRGVRRLDADDVAARRSGPGGSGGDPVLDADSVAAETIGIVGDVAGGVDAGRRSSGETRRR